MSHLKSLHPSLDHAWDLYKRYIECDKSCPEAYSLYLQAVVQMCAMVQAFVSNVKEEDREEVVLSLANVLDIAARRN